MQRGFRGDSRVKDATKVLILAGLHCKISSARKKLEKSILSEVVLERGFDGHSMCCFKYLSASSCFFKMSTLDYFDEKAMFPQQSQHGRPLRRAGGELEPTVRSPRVTGKMTSRCAYTEFQTTGNCGQLAQTSLGLGFHMWGVGIWELAWSTG